MIRIKRKNDLSYFDTYIIRLSCDFNDTKYPNA